MYVPQVTSGPSSFSWSPDGREVVYSMQGSLWRQPIDSTTAVQLTNDATYDFQPDWSPDGKSVVYSAYDGRAFALRVLDLETGMSRALVENGAVNIDPRWSPDGTRVAFVSSLFEGRWHVFIASRDSTYRVTEDRDSRLPRYYYSRFDHYLSPTWSPDGTELILVSNRGRIYGTGGLWRMEARAGATPREIHYEETTWRARPDWSPDGKRVAFSSYQGRQWHQLWLTTSEPGYPVQLTYGEFDATAPRWSPDGGRIGYVSNESGNTTLWIVTIPGGARQRVEPREKRYKGPVGQLRIAITDSATRRAMPARLAVRSAATGKYYAPDNRWRHADEAILRDAHTFEYGYWHSPGSDALTLPAGTYRVEVWRGPEWRTASRLVTVAAAQPVAVRIPLARLSNMPSLGWWGGDAHVHMNYGGAYRNTPARLAAQARAEGLHVVENLAVNKEQRIPDVASWRPGLAHRSADVIVANAQEFHTGLWGHASFLGLGSHLLLPDYAGYPGTAMASLHPSNAAVFDLAHRQDAVTGYVHPFDFRPHLNEIQSGIPYGLPVDVALGKVDFLEVMGYSDHLITSEIWYRLLNCGFRLPAAAGTDAFANFSQGRGPPGLVRVYAKAGTRLDHARWLAAIRAGRTMVTNAPLVTFTLDGREPGSEIRVPYSAARRRMRARVRVVSGIPVDRVEIVRNGAVIARMSHAGDTAITVAADSGGWFLARAYASSPRLQVLDAYPFASTSPVYVEVGNAPRSCGADAEFFLNWINLLRQRVLSDTNWNTPEERTEALELISRAHQEFIRRR